MYGPFIVFGLDQVSESNNIMKKNWSRNSVLQLGNYLYISAHLAPIFICGWEKIGKGSEDRRALVKAATH